MTASRINTSQTANRSGGWIDPSSLKGGGCSSPGRFQCLDPHRMKDLINQMKELWAWTYDLMAKPHPTFNPRDFTIVEEAATGRLSHP